MSDEPEISREEFIDDYVRDRGIEADVMKTPWGYYWLKAPDVAVKAVRCTCSHDWCDGWVMRSAQDIAYRKANKIRPPVGQEE